MSTTLIDKINNTKIYADRAEKDKNGFDIAETYAAKAGLANVALSGSYWDLSNTPSVQSPLENSNSTTVDNNKVNVNLVKSGAGQNISGLSVEPVIYPGSSGEASTFTDGRSDTKTYYKFDSFAYNPNADFYMSLSDDATYDDFPVFTLMVQGSQYSDITSASAYGTSSDSFWLAGLKNGGQGFYPSQYSGNLDFTQPFMVFYVTGTPSGNPKDDVDYHTATYAGGHLRFEYRDASPLSTQGLKVDADQVKSMMNLTVTASDNDKVLKATYSGGVGSYSWEQAPSPVNIHTITISSYDWEPLHPRSMIFQVDGWFDEDFMGGGYTFEASRSFPRQGYTYNGGYDTETWALNTLDATNGIYELVYEGNARDWNGMSSDGWTSLQSLASNNGGIVQAKILSIDLTDVTSFSGTPLGTSWVAYGNWYFFNTGSITNMNYALDGVNNIAPVNPSSASTLYPLDLHSCTDLSYAFMGNLSHSTFTGDIPEIIIPTTGSVDVSSAFYGQTGFTGGITACYNRWSSNTDIISHSNCFSYCGSGNAAGQAELATIPQSWGGTAN